ncbi:hypothetical protein ACKFRT_00235 [Corynebacterium sp. YSMAA1_1_F7]|uniref:hypothetical protein n=1 Tax=Corynebacterium sp. YSMAA1_1_F7 TaxID=3383590 RepID=UPI0038D02461
MGTSRGRRFFGKVGKAGQGGGSGAAFLDAMASGTTKPHPNPSRDEWGDDRPDAEQDRHYLEQQRPPHWG